MSPTAQVFLGCIVIVGLCVLGLWLHVRSLPDPRPRQEPADPARTSALSGGAGQPMPRVSANRHWRCPGCNALLEKKALGVVWQPGEDVAKVTGTATCDKCGQVAAQADVYGGHFDYVEQADTRTVVCHGCKANLKILSDYQAPAVTCPGCGVTISL